MACTRLLLLVCALLFAFGPVHARPTLVVYTYESFTAEWGPGPVIEENFEAECDCDLQFIAVADGVALLNRLRLEGEAMRADIVLGLDTNLTEEAKATGLFAPHRTDLASVRLPIAWQDEHFVPFDYAHFAVVYDSEAISDPPQSLKALVEGDPTNKIVIQDPRTSTPGLGLLLWIKAVYGNEAQAAWKQLADRVLTVTPGWSESYGLFTSGEAPMVLSYVTSPAYHMVMEDSERYKAAIFEEGHYLQIEVAGMTTKGAANPLATRFLSFMTGPGFQDAIPEGNWMLPAGRTGQPLHPAFTRLVEPSSSLLLDSAVVAQSRRGWIDEWLAAMSR